MIRVISGSLKGKAIKVVNSASVRPTTNRVREAIFNLLNSYLHQQDISFDTTFVLDVFAGSGGLGIEALSRGAKFVCFTDHDSKVLHLLHKNLQEMNISRDIYSIKKINVCSKLSVAQQAANIAFFDPPYCKGIMQQSYENLLKSNRINKETIIVYESMFAEDLPCLTAHEWRVIKKYGNTRIAIS